MTSKSGRLGIRRRISGHAWTVLPQIARRLRPRQLPGFESWSTEMRDGDVGDVALSGELRHPPGATSAVVVVHGLGGRPASPYCRSAVAGLHRSGFATLNLALRGADLQGTDYYNVAQTADLHAALASPALAEYERLYVLGFSMGGHVGLHLAADPHDARLVAVAAICSPVHLESAQRFVDARPRAIYRRHVLRGLKAIYAAVAKRREVPTPVERVARIRSIYEWDELAICPRYGFRDPSECYARLSVGPRLGELRVPALLVAGEADPMVPRDTLLQSLPPSCERLEVRWARRGGHVSFAPGLDLGCGPRLGLVGQVASWFARHSMS